MAQTFTATAAQTFGTTGFFQSPPKTIEKGYIIRATTLSLSFSATVSAVLQMVPVPKGCQVHDVILYWDFAGSADMYTLHVGDSLNVKRYISSASCSGSGVVRMGGGGSSIAGGMGYSYSAENVVQVKVSALSGAAAVSGSIRLAVMYSMDNNEKG